MKKAALGKGLSALITMDSDSNNPAYIPELDINKILPNPYQPRMKMEEGHLAELAASIKENGIIEPLIVTKKLNGTYELIAGERRLRASKLAKLETVPVIVKEASPQQMLELAVIENIQRADLNPLEEAMAFEQLIHQFNMTHGEIADKVGFSRPAIANKIRLLQLPEVVKKGLLDEIITEGHARAIQGLSDNTMIEMVYTKVAREKMSVRAVEEYVRRLNMGGDKKIMKNTILMDDVTIEIERGLKGFFEMENVKLRRSARGGKIEINYKTDSELAAITEKLGISKPRMKKRLF